MRNAISLIGSILLFVYIISVCIQLAIGPSDDPKMPPAGRYSVEADARYPGLTEDY